MAFSDYALTQWASHFEQAQYYPDIAIESQLFERVESLYQSGLVQFHWWLSIGRDPPFMQKGTDIATQLPFEAFGLCAFYGHFLIARRFSCTGSLNLQRSPFNITPLQMASLASIPTWYPG